MTTAEAGRISVKLSVAPGGAAEGEVIEESHWGAIRALSERGLAKKAIARELGLDIKTVRKWLRKPWRPQQRPKRGRVLDRWRRFLRGRAPEVGYNAQVLFQELQEKGYAGSYPSVSRYIRAWREAARAEAVATVRFETEPGEQAQVDWGSTWVWLGEARLRVHVFVMVLAYSRRLFARAYRNERLESLLDGHTGAFAHLGGCPQTILYDNPRTIVREKDDTRGVVVWNPGFKDRMDFYGVEPKLCRYYRAQTKGKVESGVKYVKRNALAGRRFGDLDDLNAWFARWAVEIADRRVHGTTGERPAERFARAEAEALRPVDRRPPPLRERVEHRVVPRDGYVALDTNRYPVPFEWIGQQVEVHCFADELLVRLNGEDPVQHARLLGKHQVGRWRGDPRRIPSLPSPSEGPPRLDPAYLAATGEVEARSLAYYEALCEGGAS
jgi:transposase